MGIFRAVPAHSDEHGGEVEAGRHDLKRVNRKRFLLDGVYIVVHPVCERQDGGNADDSDRAGDGRHDSAALLGQQVVGRKRERGEERHARSAGGLGVCGGNLLRGGLVGARVGYDPAVGKVDDAVGVLLRQVGVVGDHDDQAVAGDLLEDLHDLHAGLAVQRAGGLVGQHDLRIIDQSAGDGHALHLAAAHFAGLLIELIRQAHALQRPGGALPALLRADAADGQRQFNIGQHVLMRDQVIALEHKAHRMIAVAVPILVGVLAGGAILDDQIALGIAVQPADDIEQGGFAAARRTENGHKLVFAEGNIDPLQGVYGKFTGNIILADVLEREHGILTFQKME